MREIEAGSDGCQGNAGAEGRSTVRDSQEEKLRGLPFPCFSAPLSACLSALLLGITGFSQESPRQAMAQTTMSPTLDVNPVAFPHPIYLNTYSFGLSILYMIILVVVLFQIIRILCFKYV